MATMSDRQSASRQLQRLAEHGRRLSRWAVRQVSSRLRSTSAAGSSHSNRRRPNGAQHDQGRSEAGPAQASTSFAH